MLPDLADLSIVPTDNVRLLAGLTGMSAREVLGRMQRNHRAWLALMAGEPIAWGWCAAKELSIGELGISCPIPPANRYLWDFFTVPEWRGRGIYPRLLQAIVASEPEVERFWLGHDMENVASARGIANAGFREVGVLYRRPDGAFALVPSGPLHVVAAASALFGVPVADPRATRIA